MIVAIKSPDKPLSGKINPQSSKNYTTRYILASCLAEGKSTVFYPAVQDDAVAMVRCCQKLGAKLKAFTEADEEIEFTIANRKVIQRLEIVGFGDSPQTPEDGILDPDNAGAVLRMLIGVACLCEGDVTFQTEKYPDSLGKRPNADLVAALRQFGIKVDTVNDEGTLPLKFSEGHILLGKANWTTELHQVEISGAVSSQYLSSLLFMAPLLAADTEITVTNGLKSKPLIQTTLDVLKDAGINYKHSPDFESFMIMGGQKYRARDWYVNGDWPGVAAVLAAAVVVPGSEITLSRMKRDQQGEQNCLEFYKHMGCEISWEEEGEEELILKSPQSLNPAVIDGDRATDAVLAMMGAAAAASGTSVFGGIYNLQFKECDRVREPISEMRRIFETTISTGAKATWEPMDDPQKISVTGSSEGFEGDVDVDGRGDHRVIMLLSLMALKSQKPVRIHGAHHVAKSYPGWFETLEQMGVKVEYPES